MHKVRLLSKNEAFERDSDSDNVQDQIDHTFNLDKVIADIEATQILNPGSRCNLKDLDCQALCVVVKQKILEDNMVIDIEAPVKICGDIHGQIFDLMRIFDLCGHPSNHKYLFLGDYIDRGKASLDVISALFAYKIKYPNNIFLLRGNHESNEINRVYGFRKEIIDRFGSTRTWKSFNDAFDCLPIAAIVDNSVFCCHGGISPEFLRPECTNLKDAINTISRPAEVPMSGIMCDLLWADPTEMDLITGARPIGWIANNRGCSYTFGFDIIEKFLDKFNLDLIVRAHQVVSDGYEFYCDGSLVTVFSASNYCGTFDNAAGIFNLEPNVKEDNNGQISLNGRFYILPPNKKLTHQWTKNKKNKIKNESGITTAVPLSLTIYNSNNEQ